MTKANFLASCITPVDLPSGAHHVGQHEVPSIPESLTMLNSDTQDRCIGIDIDSKFHHFGARGSILFEDSLGIPLADLRKPHNALSYQDAYSRGIRYLIHHGILVLFLNLWMKQCLYP